MRNKFSFCPASATTPAPGDQQDIVRIEDRESELRALMTMAAHDLRNPLATVTAHVEMLRADHETLGDDFRRDIAAIERGLRRIDRLAQELLDYARTDRDLDLNPTPLDDLVVEIAEDHRTATARITVAADLPTVGADAGLLRHVLDNLIGNAIKYTPAGAAPDIEIHAETLADGTVRIEVADRGIGVPTGDHTKIFDAFHRCSNSTRFPGSGLGLHICRRIIERHHGRIGATPNPGGGTRFWFTLPPANQVAKAHVPGENR